MPAIQGVPFTLSKMLVFMFVTLLVLRLETGLIDNVNSPYLMSFHMHQKTYDVGNTANLFMPHQSYEIDAANFLKV